MDALPKAARFIFAVALVGFGVQFFLFVTSMPGPIPGPPWTHRTAFLCLLACVGFILAGVSIAIGKMARLVSVLLGAVMLLYGLLRHVPELMKHLHDPSHWTVVFEIVAMGGGAWVLARSFPADGKKYQPSDITVWKLANAGRFLIAISLLVFAVQHFMYAGFVATLVPSWIPAHLFWAYFTGGAFIASALAIAANKAMRLTGMLLGSMFLLWVVVLHAPRVAAALHKGNEVTSLFVALAMSGVGYALAGWEVSGDEAD
jgi:uncharacterized membrane protein YphA (DoxX/SURF4 family)